jgi:hypothetical protein
MSVNRLKDTAIVGVGRTEYSTELLGSSVGLAIEAISVAVADSGLDMADIDGIVKYTVDSSTSIELLAANLPMHNLAFWAEIPHGGGCGGRQHSYCRHGRGYRRYSIHGGHLDLSCRTQRGYECRPAMKECPYPCAIALVAIDGAGGATCLR